VHAFGGVKQGAVPKALPLEFALFCCELDPAIQQT